MGLLYRLASVSASGFDISGGGNWAVNVLISGFPFADAEEAEDFLDLPKSLPRKEFFLSNDFRGEADGADAAAAAEVEDAAAVS